jgi:hypothetical protein
MRKLGLLILTLAGIAGASSVQAGVDGCFNAEQCAEPCPITPCSIPTGGGGGDGDCPPGEVCVLSDSNCCASSSCDCVGGEWVCTADCVTGAAICVPVDSPTCVPALSTAAVALLAVAMAAALAVALRRRRLAG